MGSDVDKGDENLRMASAILPDTPEQQYRRTEIILLHEGYPVEKITGKSLESYGSGVPIQN